jgi:RimJ/RimL family protein N-acetyltransferase
MMGGFAPRTVMLKGGESVVLRAAAADDAAEALTFFRRVAASTDQIATQPDETPPTVEAERELIEQRLRTPTSLMMLATHGGAIIGVLGFWVAERRRLAHAGTLGISIEESWRNRGVGRAMIQATLDWARAHPTIEKVCLSVFSSNGMARALYRKLGFVEEGCRTGQAKLGPGRYVDEIYMGVWVKPRNATAGGG